MAENSGREVAYEDIVKGYELSKGKVVLLEPEEIKALAPRRSRTIEIEQFVDLADIDPIVWDAPYYLGPGDDAAAKSYELLRRAMEETGKVGIGRFVMRNKEYLVTVRPLGKGLVHRDHALPGRDPRSEGGGHRAAVAGQREPARAGAGQAADRVAEREVGPQQVRGQLTATGSQSLIQKKAKGQKIVVEEAPPEEGKVVDLMEALKASLKGGNAGGGEAGKQSSSARRSSRRYARAASAPGPCAFRRAHAAVALPRLIDDR